MIKHLLFAICAFLIWSQDAKAQCSGNFQPGEICGNPLGSSAPPRGAPTSSFVTVTGMPVVANNAALRALTPALSTAYRAGFTTAGDGGAMIYNFSSTPCVSADNGAQVSSTAVTGCWTANFGAAPVNVLVWGATCGSSDSSAAILAAIAALFALPQPGGTLIIPCLITMNSALAIPYTGTTPPQQPPLRITGLGAASFDGTLMGRQPPGGGILRLLYTGGDGMHPAKIDTRGIGILEIDHLRIEDSGTSNFTMLQTTNTVVHSYHNHYSGNPNCVAPACSQDILQFGGITNAAATVGTAAADAGFQGIGSSSINDKFSYCRHAVNFGGSGNAIEIFNAITDYTCGSAEVTGAPFVFYGVGLQTIGNRINGGTVELSHYPYAVSFRDNASGCASGGSYKNTVDGLGAYDEMGGSLGYAYFQSTCDQTNSIKPGYTNVAGNILNGPGAAGQLCLVAGGGLVSSLPYFSDCLGVAKTLGNSAILAFGVPGTAAARLLAYGINDGGTGVGVLGPAGNTVNGIVGNLWELDYFGVAARATIDQAGNLGVGGRIAATLATDATKTTRTVCQEVSTSSFFFGSGAAGICLGTSGAQFKNIIGPITAGIEEIAKLPLWDYRFRPGYGDDGARLQYGPTAQDVEKILPGLVGHDEITGEAINYDWGAFVPISLHALQQLSERICRLDPNSGKDPLCVKLGITRKSPMLGALDSAALAIGIMFLIFAGGYSRFWKKSARA